MVYEGHRYRYVPTVSALVSTAGGSVQCTGIKTSPRKVAADDSQANFIMIIMMIFIVIMHTSLLATNFAVLLFIARTCFVLCTCAIYVPHVCFRVYMIVLFHSRAPFTPTQL